MRHLLLAWCVALAACGSSPCTGPQSTRPAPSASPPPPIEPAAPERTAVQLALDFALPAPRLGGAKQLLLWATHYYLPTVTPVLQGYPLRDLKGAALGPQLSLHDWCNAALQGSVRVLGSYGATIFNYAGVADEPEAECEEIFPAFPAISRTRFRVARGRYGDGFEDRVLVPYRTLAVDPETIPFGSVVYIPRARGEPVTLPAGAERSHDGYFLAADRGGAIKGDHVDVFIGLAQECPFSFVGNRPSRSFVAYLVDAPDAVKLLREAHRSDDAASTSPPAR